MKRFWSHFLLLHVMISFIITGCGEDVLKRPPFVTDVFKQNTASQVDILWVVDNSNSMSVEQEALGSAFNEFIEQLEQSQVDYHVAVVSTDPAQAGTLQTGSINKAIFDTYGGTWPHTGTPSNEAFITTDTENPSQVFAENVTVGIWGSPQEQGLYTMSLALGMGKTWNGISDPIPTNRDFIRSNASLFIIFVSDEDDKSWGNVQYYYRIIEAYKGKGNDGRISISAIVGPGPSEGDDEGGCFQADRGSASYGERYIQLATLTGGIDTSICENFNTSLAKLSYAAAGLQAKFGPLSRSPNITAHITCGDAYDDQPLCVKANGQPVMQSRENGWEILQEEGQSLVTYVVFYGDAIPAPQTEITVEYMSSGVATSN